MQKSTRFSLTRTKKWLGFIRSDWGVEFGEVGKVTYQKLIGAVSTCSEEKTGSLFWAEGRTKRKWKCFCFCLLLYVGPLP